MDLPRREFYQRHRSDFIYGQNYDFPPVLTPPSAGIEVHPDRIFRGANPPRSSARSKRWDAEKCWKRKMLFPELESQMLSLLLYRVCIFWLHLRKLFTVASASLPKDVNS